nr:MAG TPA: hypothetical protein [Caudoviricetes sp.]
MAYVLHAPAGPPGPGARSMEACAFLGRACTCSRRALRAQVRATAAPPLAQVPATRSAAERWHRRDGGAPWHAPQPRTLARSRGPACWDGGKRRRRAEALRAVPLSCVTTATVCLRHRRTAPATACRAQFRPGSSRPLVFQGKVRYDGIHSPTFPRYSAATLPAPQAARGLRLLQRLPDLDGPCRRRYVEGPYPTGTGPPPDGPRCQPDPEQVP